MAKGTCAIEDCGRTTFCRGWCASHYRRWQQHGDPLAGPPIRAYTGHLPRGASVEERFWSKVDDSAGPFACWRWIGALNPGPSNYGVMAMSDKRREYAHRISYELSMGTIPPGYEIDHLCRNKQCVNPLHLQVVTASENVRRRPDRKVTHCPAGHPYSGDNLYEHGGRRYCKACKKERRQAA